MWAIYCVIYGTVPNVLENWLFCVRLITIDIKSQTSWLSPKIIGKYKGKMNKRGFTESFLLVQRWFSNNSNYSFLIIFKCIDPNFPKTVNETNVNVICFLKTYLHTFQYIFKTHLENNSWLNRPVSRKKFKWGIV